MEHHANIVPWQLICEEKNAKLKVIPINDDGELIFEDFEKIITDRTKFVSVVYASNSLGTINPVKNISLIAIKTLFIQGMLSFHCNKSCQRMNWRQRKNRLN